VGFWSNWTVDCTCILYIFIFSSKPWVFHGIQGNTPGAAHAHGRLAFSLYGRTRLFVRLAWPVPNQQRKIPVWEGPVAAHGLQLREKLLRLRLIHGGQRGATLPRASSQKAAPRSDVASGHE
jgi:hypothetical protein